VLSKGLPVVLDPVGVVCFVVCMWLETQGCIGPTVMCRCRCMHYSHVLSAEWLSGNVAVALVICGLQDHLHRVLSVWVARRS